MNARREFFFHIIHQPNKIQVLPAPQKLQGDILGVEGKSTAIVEFSGLFSRLLQPAADVAFFLGKMHGESFLLSIVIDETVNTIWG